MIIPLLLITCTLLWLVVTFSQRIREPYQWTARQRERDARKIARLQRRIRDVRGQFNDLSWRINESDTARDKEARRADQRKAELRQQETDISILQTEIAKLNERLRESEKLRASEATNHQDMLRQKAYAHFGPETGICKENIQLRSLLRQYQTKSKGSRDEKEKTLLQQFSQERAAIDAKHKALLREQRLRHDNDLKKGIDAGKLKRLADEQLRAENKAARQEIINIKKENAALKNDSEQQKARLNQSEARNNTQSAELSRIRGERNDWRTKCSRNESKAAEATRLENDLEKCKKKCLENEKKAAEATSLENDPAQWQKKCEAAEKQAADAQSTIEAMRKQVDGHIAEQMAAINEQVRQYVKSQSDAQEQQCKEKIDKLQSQVDSQEQQCKTKIEELQRQADDQTKTQVAAKEQEINNQWSAYAWSKHHAMTTAQQATSAAEKERDTYKAQVNTLLTDGVNQSKKHRDEIDRLTQEIRALQGQAESKQTAHDTKIQDLEKKLEDAKKALEDKQMEYDDLLKRFENLPHDDVVTEQDVDDVPDIAAMNQKLEKFRK